MVKVNLTPRALADLDEITEYAEKHSQAYASNIVKRIFDRIAQLADYPLIGRMVPNFENENVRELISGHYRIIYKVYMSSTQMLLPLGIVHNHWIKYDHTRDTGRDY